MEMHQLEYFVAVAEEASFTRAAARVHIAQPGISAQVRRLEAELGLPLLDRSARPARLTEAGAAVLPFARAALRAVADARLAVDELAGLVRGHVRVGMVSGCSLPVLTEVLAAFHDKYPAIAIALTEGASSQLVTDLREGRCDLALIGTAGDPAAGLETTVIIDEPIVAAVTPGHPLATSPSLPLRALDDQPLICLPPGTGVRAALDAACATAGFAPTIAFEASALSMVAQFAERGLGIAITPASVAGPALRRVPITDPPLSSRLEFAWNPLASAPAARMLIEQARTCTGITQRLPD